MRTRTASFSMDVGVLAALSILALGLWIALSVISGRVLGPSHPGAAPLPETPTTQPAPTNGAPAPPPSAVPANTNERLSPAPDPAQGGSGAQPGPGPIDPAQADPYPPKPKFDEPIDQPITNVKPIYIGEGK